MSTVRVACMLAASGSDGSGGATTAELCPRMDHPCLLQTALARRDLWLEAQLLEKLLYKNANQHRGAQHFQRLHEVRSPAFAWSVQLGGTSALVLSRIIRRHQLD